MKIKKGFTIIEILAVIVIIAVITSIAIPAIFKITKNSEKNIYCSKLEIVQKSAERYADDNTLSSTCEIDGVEYFCESITIQNLLNDSYIDPDGVDGAFIDPRDKIAINTMDILVYSKNDRSYAYVNEPDCPSFVTNALAPNELSNVKHLVTFALDGGIWNGTSPVTLKEGATLYVNDPIKNHYTFDRWNVTGNDSDINDQILTMGLEDTVLTAQWLINSYTLTINANGGTWSGTTPQTINYNATATINDPIRTGYTFTGWTVSGTGSSIVGTTFTMGSANTTLTANWTINNYTLTVNASGGTWGGTTPQTINYNATATINDPTRTGYTFAGWTVSGTGSTLVGTTFTMGSANTTLTANWTINNYTLTVNADGGTWSGTTPQTINYNATATINNPTKTNYVFNGWTVSGTGSTIVGTTFTMGSANTTLTANWVPSSLTLTVNASGGTWSGTTPQSLAPSATTTIADPVRANYTFNGWTVSGTGSTIVGTTFTMGTADTTLTANWVMITLYTFDYTGSVQTFTAPFTGYYLLESWGAQGGYAYTTTYNGGYGAYAKGVVYLNAGANIYIYVGRSGTNGTTKTATSFAGGYNGGGNGFGYTDKYAGGGGGATHIATVTGLLSTLSSNQAALLIAAGGGGGAAYESGSYYGYFGHGGGITGVTATKSGTYTSTGGTQTAGGTGYVAGSFGQGAVRTTNGSGGGGGGYYGGGSAQIYAGASGGSSYIANSSLLTYGAHTKSMYCYNCTTSATASTLTYTTTNVSSTATSNYAKSGNGYVKVTFINS